MNAASGEEYVVILDDCTAIIVRPVGLDELASEAGDMTRSHFRARRVGSAAWMLTDV